MIENAKYELYLLLKKCEDEEEYRMQKVINDNVNRQITIVHDASLGMRLCLDWQLDALFDLIQAGLVRKEDK